MDHYEYVLKAKVVKELILENLVETKDALIKLCLTGNTFASYYTNQLDGLILRVKEELYQLDKNNAFI